MSALRHLKSVAVAAALTLTPAVAHAQAADPVLALFQSACVATDGQANAALAKLDAAGWDVLPPELMGDDVPFDNLQARMKFEDGGILIAMTGDMREGLGTLTSGGDVTAAVCAIGTAPGDYDAIDGAVANWLGLSPNADMSSDGLRGYPYTTVNGQRRAVSPALSEDELLEVAASGDMRIVMTGDTDGVIMIMFMRPETR